MPMQTRSKWLAQDNQEVLQRLKNEARTRGTTSQQEDAGDLVEHNPNPTQHPCTARELREAMTDEDFEKAILEAGAAQGRLTLQLIQNRDPTLHSNERLVYKWEDDPKPYLLDLPTLLLRPDWVHVVSYEKDMPGEQERRKHEQRLDLEGTLGKIMQNRKAADRDRNDRAGGRKRSREGKISGSDENFQDDEVLKDRDEIYPVKRSFGKALSKRRKLSQEEKRWSRSTEEEINEVDLKDETLESDDEPILLLNEEVSDPIEELRHKYGNLVQIVYYENATATQLQSVLEAFEQETPLPSKKDRRVDMMQAVLDAKKSGALPEYFVVLPTDPTKVKEDPDLPAANASERHRHSGVNYENGTITRSQRRNKYA